MSKKCPHKEFEIVERHKNFDYARCRKCFVLFKFGKGVLKVKE
jgi:hypothetical protein